MILRDLFWLIHLMEFVTLLKRIRVPGVKSFILKLLPEDMSFTSLNIFEGLCDNLIVQNYLLNVSVLRRVKSKLIILILDMYFRLYQLAHSNFLWNKCMYFIRYDRLYLMRRNAYKNAYNAPIAHIEFMLYAYKNVTIVFTGCLQMIWEGVLGLTIVQWGFWEMHESDN